MRRMEFRCCYDLGQLFHIHRFNINDVCRQLISPKYVESGPGRTETLVTDVQVPQINPQIVGRNVRLLVRIDGYGVYVVGMRIGVDLARNGGDDVILHDHSWQAKMRWEGRWLHRTRSIVMVRL